MVCHGALRLLQSLTLRIAALAARNAAGLREAWGGGRQCCSSADVAAWAALLCPAALLVVVTATVYVASRPRPVYLVDFACFRPGDARRCPPEFMMRQMRLCGGFSEESLSFQQKMLQRSGLGDSTYVPACYLRTPIDPSMAMAREEAAEALFGAADELFARTGVRPGDVGVVVVNCSLFSPTPSLSSMVVNRYGMGERVRSYSLGGMGCSAGMIAVDLARRLLQVHRDTYALVVSTESMTLNGYLGNNRPMLVTNVLFRVGGSAVLLGNRPADRRRSKYELVRTVRTHKGADDRSYRCVSQEEDDEGIAGIALSKDLMAVAGEALKANITTLGPLVLPLSEQLLFFATLVARKLLRVRGRVKPYIPDFRRAFEHFCIHAGGRAVLDELERNLALTEWHMEPSRMTLYRFGNTSSSSLWYELAYAECKGRIAAGDRVWQIAFGSGFKCNSAVWRALRAVPPGAVGNPWTADIERFPVPVAKV